ncbi:MAG: ATP-binding cassette domain-containing protein [Gammaproteobacteria bacterium]|nr:ATP-binding cassette domain-containing protein [Gammaproteobacteria bacterium]
MNSYITIKNLCFTREERSIFDGINITIPRGKITAIMGPSGTGKTTLLRLIAAQLQPDLGTIDVNGHNIHQLSRQTLFAMRQNMGMLFQSGALFTGLSVFENVAFPLRAHTSFDERMIEDRVLRKLQAVGLRGAYRLMPNALSGGMARRIALARAIVLDPQLIMYDEPFTGQDPISMGVLVKLIKQLNDSLEATSIIVSHDVQETSEIADYIYILAGGKIVGHGTPEALNHSTQPQVKQFMHGLPDGPVPFHYPENNDLTALRGEPTP